MTTKIKPMSEQQKFAFENCHIIRNFLEVRQLNSGRYYTVAARSFARAVRRYFMYPELWAYSFSAVALCEMKRDLYKAKALTKSRLWCKIIGEQKGSAENG